MYFLLLEDSRGQQGQPTKVIIANHEDKQVLEDFYKGLLVDGAFLAESVLANFIAPKEGDLNVIVEWTEAGWVESLRKEALSYIEHGNKLNADAEVNGAQKWASIMSETFSPEQLLSGFAEQATKAKLEEQVIPEVEQSYSLEATTDDADKSEAQVADFDATLAIAQSEPAQASAEF